MMYHTVGDSFQMCQLFQNKTHTNYFPPPNSVVRLQFTVPCLGPEKNQTYSRNSKQTTYILYFSYQCSCVFAEGSKTNTALKIIVVR